MTVIANGPGAWVIGGQNRVSYNLESLLSSNKVHNISFDRSDGLTQLGTRALG